MSNRRQVMQGMAALSGTSLFGMSWEAAAQAAKGGVLVIGTTQKPRHLNSAVQSGLATMFPAAQLFASPIRNDGNYRRITAVLNFFCEKMRCFMMAGQLPPRMLSFRLK
jgi:hypothetical protein